MSEIVVTPTISAQSGGFVLRVESVNAQRAWQKGYGNERDAYTEAVDIGLAHDEYFGNIHRRRLEAEVSIEIERLEKFGLRKIVLQAPGIRPQ